MHQDFPSSQDSPAGSVSQQGLMLPTAAVQSQIHELAKTLPPPRKQNTACDACRSRKVKCHRLPGQEKCQHCLSKNYPCTHYVQQATSEKKRSANLARRPRNLSGGSRYSSQDHVRAVSNTSSEGHHSPRSSTSPTSNTTLLPETALVGIPLISNPGTNAGPLTFNQLLHSTVTLDTPTSHVLAYLFSPPDSSRSISDAGHPKIQSPYAEWGELAYKLEGEAFRAEFALDLVEIFFQIVHTRIPLLNPAQFRARLNLQPPSNPTKPSAPQDANGKPLHPALVATVIAWGTKFSEHTLLASDRRRPNGQSHLAAALIDRARALAESMKVHRIPSPDNVVISLLIEPLQCQHPGDSEGFQGFWLMTGIRNLLNLQINHKSVMSSIKDPEARGTMIFAWWMACLSDAFSAAYYRHKPMLDDDDYDIDFYTAEPVPQDISDSSIPVPSPREKLEFLGYYRAAHALARISRAMARLLWKPATELDGLPSQDLGLFASQLSEWRDHYLSIVGVPSNFAQMWDFVSAVSACASDATYHVMWIILFNALDEFGIKDVNDAVRIGNPSSVLHNHHQIEELQHKVADEALHGALRIAGLAGVLTRNGYLRLDPAVMQVSCTQAGTFLARLGRPEVSNCIEGLEQYSHAYVEAGEYATEMKRMYANAQSGDFDFNHMVNFVSPVTTLAAGQAMAMDVTENGSLQSQTVSPINFPHPSYGH